MSDLQTDGFTRLHVEASLCIWEDMLAAYTKTGRADGAAELTSEQHQAMSDCWENRGSAEMRHAAIDLGAPACEVWDAIPEDDQQLFVPYDWEFIPWFVNQIGWDGHASEVAKLPLSIKERLADEIVLRRGCEAVLRGVR